MKHLLIIGTYPSEKAQGTHNLWRENKLMEVGESINPKLSQVRQWYDWLKVVQDTWDRNLVFTTEEEAK